MCYSIIFFLFTCYKFNLYWCLRGAFLHFTCISIRNPDFDSSWRFPLSTSSSSMTNAHQTWMQHLDNQTSLVTSMIACTAEVLPHKFCGARYIHIRGIKTHLQHSHDKNWKRLQHNAGSTNLFFYLWPDYNSQTGLNMLYCIPVLTNLLIKRNDCPWISLDECAPYHQKCAHNMKHCRRVEEPPLLFFHTNFQLFHHPQGACFQKADCS